MSVSAKILIFAVVALLATCTLGASLLFGAQAGKRIRERLISSQEQLDTLNRLKDDAWHYLNVARQAREQGEDLTRVRREFEGRLEAERARFEVSIRTEEEQGGTQAGSPREGEREEFEQILQALRPWMERVEERLRAEPEGVPVASGVQWALYQDYQRQVGQHIASIHAREWEERAGLRSQWNANVQLGLAITRGVTFGCCVLIVLMTGTILLPLRGSLHKLRVAAERIGRGDFEVSVPTMGRDELGLLAHAMNRMAVELHDTLQEKQRLVKAEAEASEREARRYSAMLEETVRARTSELEQSLRQLRATQEQLLFADRLAAVGRLAAGVGHEINNPLSYLISNLRFVQGEVSRMAAASSPEHEEVMEALAAAREGAERVRLIVHDLKMLARPDDVALGPVELERVVRTAARFAEQEIFPRARLVVDCQEVPPAQANEPRLVQVLLNLLINAAQAIEPGRAEENEIRVVARAGDPGHVIVEVNDTGCGIPPENLERIFEPFFTTKEVGVGTGLGLSLCRSLVSSLGGSIQVESQMGRGSTFRLNLPMA